MNACVCVCVCAYLWLFIMYLSSPTADVYRDAAVRAKARALAKSLFNRVTRCAVVVALLKEVQLVIPFKIHFSVREESFSLMGYSQKYFLLCREMPHPLFETTFFIDAFWKWPPEIESIPIMQNDIKSWLPEIETHVRTGNKLRKSHVKNAKFISFENFVY
jgi:hypothetical protein